MKILAPAGNFESLKLAVYNGADEVYLGINEFNARNNIDSFTLENLEQAVDFAHVYGVKVCLAINILFSDAEIKHAINTIITAYGMGVDYFIIQDLGLIKLLYENYPEIPIHASTQMGIHNLEGVKFIEQYGVKRVVLARETPLSEINRIRQNSDIEIEYFVQGALCVSFSGNCYLSSYLHGASGNRGKCKQLCRLPYTLYHGEKKVKNGYLLSAKDFNMSSRLGDLKKAGVDVIKIEGRARRPSYVGMATREYYNALHGKSFNQDAMSLAFNREFTSGYFDGNGKIISEFNNHVGIAVGKVESVKIGKNFNQVYISSNRKLSPKSTFKIFVGGVEKNTLTAYDLTETSKGKYLLTTTQKVEVGGKVRLIIDSEMENAISKSTKKRAVDLFIDLKKGQPITAKFTVLGNEFSVFGDLLLPAENRPITENEIKENFLKSEYFAPNIKIGDCESVFLAKSRLNEFRRSVYDKLIEVIVQSYKKTLEEKPLQTAKCIQPLTDFQIVNNVNTQLTAKNIIFSPESYECGIVAEFIKKCESVGAIPYLDTPNFVLEEDVKRLLEIIEQTNVKIVANNYYAFMLGNVAVIGAGLNVYNSYTAQALGTPYLIAEGIGDAKVDFPYMTLRHCPIKSHVGGDCNNCKYDGEFYYVTDSGKKLKLSRKKLSTCTFYLTD